MSSAERPSIRPLKPSLPPNDYCQAEGCFDTKSVYYDATSRKHLCNSCWSALKATTTVTVETKDGRVVHRPLNRLANRKWA